MNYDPEGVPSARPVGRAEGLRADALEAAGNTRSVERALNILEAFTVAEPELTVTDLSRKLVLNKSTVHRLAGLLERRGFLLRNPKTRAYALGPAIFRFVGLILRQGDIASVSLPHMVALRDQTGETIGLNIRVGRNRACIAQIESPHELRMRLDIGRLLPLYCGAAGKVLLAHMAPEEIEEVIRETGLAPLGPGSIRDPEVLRRQLSAIRRDGYAISREERMAGGHTLAAPVRDRNGLVVASLSVYGPSVRLSDARIEELRPAVMAVTASISKELGFLGDSADGRSAGEKRKDGSQ